MDLFKKFFNSNKNKESKINSELITPIPQKRSIFDFFQINLKNIPDESFIEAEVETNTTGEIVQNFRKSLSNKECGIFDTIEVKIIGRNSKNIFLKSFEPDKVDYGNLKTLIDELYLIYGNDFEDKGKFTNKDIEDYDDIEFSMLFGRRWAEHPKYRYPVAVGRDENEVSISIWGVELS